MSNLSWEQKRMCFEMLQRWSSDGHRRSRDIAWDALSEFGKTENNQIELALLKQNDPAKYHAIFAVLYFFMDLKSLLQHHVLHEELANQLFANHFEGWQAWFKRLRFASKETQSWVEDGLAGLDKLLN
jgi:hypothetical protein